MFDNPETPSNILHFSKPTPKPYACKKTFKKIFRFKIILQDVVPSVWRRLEVPDCYTFWDLHIAITDAFDWLDYHLHEFEMTNPKTNKPVRIGSPDDEGFDQVDDVPSAKSDRKKKISGIFSFKNRMAIYRYDFGDGWEHSVELEEIMTRDETVSYPRCIEGEMACPPDDCGGVAGYESLLSTIRNPRNKEHKSMVQWLEGMKGKGWKPAFFDPAAVHFDNPDKRWKIAYEGGVMTSDMRGWDFYRRREGR